MAKAPTRKVSIVVPIEVYDKISHIMESERLRSFSLAATRLLQEALETYPDPDQPELPFSTENQKEQR